MRAEVMLEEYPDEKVRAAVCNNQWNKREVRMMDWIPVFKTGFHSRSESDRNWSIEDLDKMIASTAAFGENVPFVIGHPKKELLPWGKAEPLLKRVGDFLYAKPKEISKAFKEIVKEGLNRISIKVSLPDLRVQHIGFFGPEETAVDLPGAAFMAGEEAFALIFSAPEIEGEFAEDTAKKAPAGAGSLHSENTDRERQAARSKKYNIGIKEGGHMTKPGEWADVADDDFLDPVNYRYPCPDADQTRAAAGYWGKPKNQEQYSSEERGVINRRLEEKKKKFKIGDYAKNKGGTAMSLKDTLKRAFTKAVDDIPEEDLKVEPQMFSEAEVKAQVEKATKEAAEKAKAEGKKETEVQFAEQKKELKKTELTTYVDGLIKGDDKKGRALSAAKKAGLVEFMLRLDDEETIEFAEGKEKASMLAQMKAILETLPQDITFSEVADKEKDVDPGDTAAQREKAIAEFSAAHQDMSYKEVVLAVSKKHPELFKPEAEA
jgi:hypothetical protein